MASARAFGVSPAFVLSGWGEGFSPADFCRALETLSRLGIPGFQLEVYLPERLGEWVDGGAAAVAARARDLALAPTQFVAHFLMPCVATAEAIRGADGLEEMREVVGLLDHHPSCGVVTLPVGAFASDRPLAFSDYSDLRKRLADKVARLLDIVAASGRRLALEVPPHTLLGGSEGFAALADEIASDRLGFNLDTGHAWACKEPVELLPFRLAGRIFGTHLCDNFGHENAKLRPGAGSIPWKPLLRNLAASGYSGSLDQEIRCAPADLEREYGAGLAHLREVGDRT